MRVSNSTIPSFKAIGVFLALLLSALTVPLKAQGTYTANSCNQSDVNAVINGPTHTAVAGDTIVIPAGTCTWNSGLSISAGITLTGSGTPNTGSATFGSGTLNTVIIDNAGSSNALIGVTGLPYGQTFTLGLLDIEPKSSSTALISPIQVAGTCTSTGCPSIRVHNIGFGLTTPWVEGGNGAPANWMIRTDNVFGVIDHNRIPPGSNVMLLSANHSAYLGVGAYGDNSWAQPDSFGTNSALYVENNNLNITQSTTECETAPSGGGMGGCRIVGRFNNLSLQSNSFTAFEQHGLDTNGRPQGGRQLEAYNNTITCTGGSCGAVVSYRSGTGFAFGNSITTQSGGGSWFNNIASITVYRTVFKASGGWGACGGSSPYDTNDGTVYYSGTTSSSGTTLTDSTKSWGTNQLVPNGAPFSVYDVTQGWWAEIRSNTANTLTIQDSIPEENNSFNSGDSYQILRASVCADQGGRGAGNYVSGATATQTALSQALDPIYEFNNSFSGSLTQGHVGTNTGRTIANRDWYTDNGAGKQTSPTSPFNGTSGVGVGTLANRPTTCKQGVGYWATDQGSWNSGGTGGQGQLFVCTATNQWSLYYTPYAYPHPLTTTQGSGGGSSPSPPSNLAAIAQ